MNSTWMCRARSWVLLIFGVSVGWAWTAEASVLPEAHDPVLGSEAAVVEWAWSPQYAKRYDLPAQSDGLKDGYLWLVGVKVIRMQSKESQIYDCRIVGLIDNKAPMLWPPGDRYVRHTAHRWLGGLPGRAQAGTDDLARFGKGHSEQSAFVPGHAAWIRQPENERERTLPERSMTSPYLLFHRYHTADLAYFELEGACWYFNDPEAYRNELRFPTRIDGVDDENPRKKAIWEPSALKFDIPDRVMVKMYPFLLKASDWSKCLMRRRGEKSGSIFRDVKERLGDVSCEPMNPK